MLMNLWVRDKSNGEVHQVGTDPHDSLDFINGRVHYHNLQNGCGTFDEYEWVEAPDMDDYVSVTPDQLYVNKELIHRDFLAVINGESVPKIVHCENCQYLFKRDGYGICANSNIFTGKIELTTKKKPFCSFGKEKEE